MMKTKNIECLHYVSIEQAKADNPKSIFAIESIDSTSIVGDLMQGTEKQGGFSIDRFTGKIVVVR